MASEPGWFRGLLNRCRWGRYGPAAGSWTSCAFRLRGLAVISSPSGPMWPRVGGSGALRKAGSAARTGSTAPSRWLFCCRTPLSSAGCGTGWMPSSAHRVPMAGWGRARTWERAGTAPWIPGRSLYSSRALSSTTARPGIPGSLRRFPLFTGDSPTNWPQPLSLTGGACAGLSLFWEWRSCTSRLPRPTCWRWAPPRCRRDGTG